MGHSGHGLVMISFLYMYVCFASAVYVPELWPTHLRLRGSGFVNAVGWIVAVFTLRRGGFIDPVWICHRFLCCGYAAGGVRADIILFWH